MKIVWIKIINPIDKGWFKKNIIIDIIIIIKDKKIFISKNSLIKIIILEIIDKENSFSLKFLKKNLIFDLQDQCFFLNYKN